MIRAGSRGVYLYMCECVYSRLYTCTVAKDMANYGVFVLHVVTFWLYSVCGVICTTDDFVGVSNVHNTCDYLT